jgi:transposase
MCGLLPQSWNVPFLQSWNVPLVLAGFGDAMPEGCLLMSSGERERSHLVRLTVEGKLRQREAAERLGLGLRQFKRLVQGWRRAGDAGLVNRQRGGVSNNALPASTLSRIEALLREHYADFGPTLAAEKLAERDGIVVSRETVRQVQIRLQLHRPKRRRAKRVFQLRERRPRFGELVQIDGSPHDWFEGRGPRCTLIVFIDDATGRLTALRFAPAESFKAYVAALRDHVLAQGVPLAFYSDRHGIFRVNAKDAAGGDGKTEFGRVAARLGIELIHALTPQAKGRVERANQTLQDRLIKEMRLRQIGSMDAAQAFLPTFISWWNETLAVTPRDAAPAHRPWTKGPDALELALARQEERVLSKALTFSYRGTKYCVKTPGPGTALRGAKVLVHDLADGRMHVTYKDRGLACTAYGSYPVPAPAEDEKTLDLRVDALAAARKGTARQPPATEHA